MNKLIISGLIVLVVGLSVPQTTQAQGTTYLSNLGQPITGSVAVGSDSWAAAEFFTGTNSGGYFLNSFQLAMNDALGTPSGFTVMLYTAVAGAGLLPGSSLGSLSGSSDPSTAGTYTYAAPANLTSSQRATYFIVLTAGTPVAIGAYEWSLAGTSSYNPIGNWAANVFFHSNDGSSWSHIAGDYAQFAINATSVSAPETGCFSLIRLGQLVLPLASAEGKGSLMKKLTISGLIALALGLSAPQITQAQGTTYLSNLGQISSGSTAIGSDSWLAADIISGTNAGGYVLNSIQLAITDSSGNPSGFAAMLYGIDRNLPGGISPGSNLGSLSGSPSPTTAGIYTYTAASNLTLSPRTDYFIVLTAATTLATGAYEWSLAGINSYNPNGGWAITQGASSGVFHSSDGSTWNSVSRTYPQFAINATAQVPEPAVSALFVLGGLCFLWLRRKARAV